MSSCDLEIVLERPGATLRFGDTVRGVVGVTVDKTCTCRALTVRVEWYTHGMGNESSGASSKAMLFEGEWAAGEKHLFPFELTVGKGPLPYHGHLLNVDWRVFATADIPWGFDPRAQAELVVVDDPALPEIDHGPAVGISHDPQGSQLIGLAIVGAILFSTVGPLVLVGPFIVVALAFEGALLVGLAVGGLVTLIPLAAFAAMGFVAFRALGPRLAARRLGDPVVRLDPVRLRGGETVSARVTVKPRRTTDIRGFYAVLSAREDCISGSGTNTTRRTHEVWSERVALGHPRTVLANVEVAFEGQLRLPRDPAPSFHAVSNALEWAVEIHAELPRGPDWVSRHRLMVRP